LRRAKKPLSGKQAHAIVVRRLRKIDKLSFLESFAIFMGKTQIVELGLKGLLVRQYGYDDEQIEKWNLGRTIRELRERGLRQDFVGLIEELNGYRNSIAHDLLVDEALMRKWIGSNNAQRHAWKRLSRGLYWVEMAIVVHDFLFGNEAQASITPQACAPNPTTPAAPGRRRRRR
jgi:hypothetical protein